MTNKFKKILVGIVASAMCVTGSMGAISASAADTTNLPVDSISISDDGIMSVNHSYAWSNIKSVTTLDEGFSLNTSKSVTISFCNCTVGAASVKLYKYGNSSPVLSIAIPNSSIPTQYITQTLAAGSYYFTVCPATGYEKTSGSLYVQNADGVTETT